MSVDKIIHQRVDQFFLSFWIVLFSLALTGVCVYMAWTFGWLIFGTITVILYLRLSVLGVMFMTEEKPPKDG